MGVSTQEPKRPKGLPAESQIKEYAWTECVRVGCPSDHIYMEMTQEDEEIVQYDGACKHCGFEYHLILKKEYTL